MPTFEPSENFVKALERLGPAEKKRAHKSLSLFLANERHNSLRFKPLSSGYHTIRVNRNFRIIMKDAGGGHYVLVDACDHRRADDFYGKGKA